LEPHNLKSFVNPHTNHRLKHIPCVVELKKDRKISISNLLEPILRTAIEIEVIDPYLPNTDALCNLKSIIDSLSFDCKITLKFLKRDLYVSNNKQREKQFNELSDYIKELRVQKVDVKTDYKISKKHSERWLITQKYRVYLPGGLDCIKKNGYPNLESENDVSYLRIEYVNQ